METELSLSRYRFGFVTALCHENNMDTTIAIDWTTKVYWNDSYELPSKLWTHNSIDREILLSLRHKFQNDDDDDAATASLSLSLSLLKRIINWSNVARSIQLSHSLIFLLVQFILFANSVLMFNRCHATFFPVIAIVVVPLIRILYCSFGRHGGKGLSIKFQKLYR